MKKKQFINKIKATLNKIPDTHDMTPPASCEKFSSDTLDQYWEGLLTPDDEQSLESHCINCEACLASLAEAMERHELTNQAADKINNDDLMASARRIIYQTAEQNSDVLLWAAEPDRQGGQGEAFGVVVALEAGQASLMECNAWVGGKTQKKGKLELWGMQVEGTRQGVAVTRPLGYLEEKLEGIFRIHPTLRKFHLHRREINIDLKERVIREANSLSLAIVMAVINAVLQRKDPALSVYSADIRQDGKLEKVGKIAEKIAHARQANVSCMVLARENAADIPEDCQKDPNLNIVLADTIDELLTEFGIDPFAAAVQEKTPPLEQKTADIVTSRPPAASDSYPRNGTHEEYDFLISGRDNPDQLQQLLPLMEDLCQSRWIDEQFEIAFFRGLPEKIAPILPESAFELAQSQPVNAFLQGLPDLEAILGSGQAAIVLTPTDMVESIRKVNFDIGRRTDISPLLTGKNHRYACLSRMTGAMIFYFPPSGRHIHVFENGELIGKYLNGKWQPTPYDRLLATLDDCSTSHGINGNALKPICRAAISMAEHEMGALFLIARDWSQWAARIEYRLESLYGIRIRQQAIETMDVDELIQAGGQEGAVLVDQKGMLVSAGAYFQINWAQNRQFQTGRGLRHAVARLISSETNGIALVASRDGKITLIDNGEELIRI